LSKGENSIVPGREKSKKYEEKFEEIPMDSDNERTDRGQGEGGARLPVITTGTEISHFTELRKGVSKSKKTKIQGETHATLWK